MTKLHDEALDCEGTIGNFVSPRRIVCIIYLES